MDQVGQVAARLREFALNCCASREEVLGSFAGQSQGNWRSAKRTGLVRRADAKVLGRKGAVKALQLETTASLADVGVPDVHTEVTAAGGKAGHWALDFREVP